MTGPRETFQLNLQAAEVARDAMLDELRAALAGRDGWGEWERTWSHNEFGDDHQIHTRRRITWARGRGEDWLTPVFELLCTKTDGFGQVTDETRFASVAEALAWIETPRSDTTIRQRAEDEAHRRWLARDDVDLAGLLGRRIDSGLNGKRQSFEVIEFEGVGRVRITTLGGGRWRIAVNRRTRVVDAGGEDAKKTVRAAIEELHRGGQ